MTLTRRNVLKAMGVAGVGAAVAQGPLWPRGIVEAAVLPSGVSFDPAPFTLGVASGFPTSSSVTLWTRVAPDPLVGSGGVVSPVAVRWVVAATAAAVAAELAVPGSAVVVADGTVTAAAASGHSVHVDVAGLSAAQTYYYGFAALGGTSVIGRTRTAPSGATPSLRFAVASCQNFAHGYYPALRHIADENIDFVLHLGDYIYESGSGFRGGSLSPSPVTLDDYRVCHAMYKGDPDLRRAHAMHPWILTWDDHEIRNNYAGLHLPSNVAQLRTAGYQAYYEHLPIRLTAAGPPSGPSFRIYQSVVFGDLLDVALLDDRQYRDPDPCTTEELPCSETYANHPDRTMLGADQKAWLKGMLSSSTTSWRVIGTPVPFTQWTIGGAPQEANDLLNIAGVPANEKVFFNNSGWDSFNAERRELLQFILDEGIEDVVSLAGESHNHTWSNIRLDLDNLTTPIVLPEFGGCAISSNSGNAGENDARLAVYATSPQIRYFDGDTWGYMICDVTHQRWRTSAWTIRHTADPAFDPRRDVNATKVQTAVFEVGRGDPAMRHVLGDGASPVPG